MAMTCIFRVSAALTQRRSAWQVAAVMGSADAAPGTSAPGGNGTPRPPRVLSIQSHVVSGYVGNKAAVFPLQVGNFSLLAPERCDVAGLAALCLFCPVLNAGHTENFIQLSEVPTFLGSYCCSSCSLVRNSGDSERGVLPPHLLAAFAWRCTQLRLTLMPPAPQLLGFDVDPVLSVHFSNHTGFPGIAGTRMSGDQLLELLDGLEKNDLLDDYTHLLTGNLPSALPVCVIASL